MSIVGAGRVTVQAIVEFAAPFMNIREMLPDVTEDVLETNRPWIPAHLLDAQDTVHLTFQSFIVRTPHHTILVDSCVGNGKHHHRPLFTMRNSDAYLVALREAGLTPDDIDFVMCTHLHVDHVGWNTRLENGRWVPTFPKARYIFGRQEYHHWAAELGAQPETVYSESVLPIVEHGRAQLVDYDFQIADFVRLLPTPGHTPGHFAVLLGDRGDEIVLTGDLLHLPLQLRYPGLSVAFDWDRALAAKSRRTLLERFCDQPTVCCFGHLPMAMHGRIKRWSDGFRCEPIA